MTCKCGSVRFMDLYAKCNDLAHLTIEHLGVDEEGYLPDLGNNFGDEINLCICMDCGQIQGWTPIPDELVLADESIQEKRQIRLENEEYERLEQDRRKKEDKSPGVITMAHLRNDQCTRIQITPNSSILKVRPFDSLRAGLTRELLEHYKESMPWWQDTYNFGGREVKSPRLIALMGDKDYFYSGINHKAIPWDELTQMVMGAAIEKFKEGNPWLAWLGLENHSYNGVLFNYYRDGRDSISSHSDKEDGIDLSVPITSVNLGATRIFHVHAGNNTYKIPLMDGDAILMTGKFQEECKHSIPKEKEKGERINLTFRKFK